MAWEGRESCAPQLFPVHTSKYPDMTTSQLTKIGSPSNDAEPVINAEIPYLADFEVCGSAALLLHRWSVDAIEAKGKAAKGSKARKEDDLESYVYRDEQGTICIPAEYFRMAVVNAAKFKQDPRSPRKSAMDLFKAGVACIEELCPTGLDKWDYVDRRRVMVQRNGITRSRPALNKGWQARVTFQVALPEYISPELMNEVMQFAGRLVGVGDFRPTFGRFQVTRFGIIGI